MSPRFRPPGKTFKERWPHEAEETRYFAATMYAVVVGGVLGVLMVPVVIWEVLSGTPLAFAIVVGLLGVVTMSIGLLGGAGRRWLTLAWKIGAWVVGAAAVGLAFESVVIAICGEACLASNPRSRPPLGIMIAWALQVVSSVGVASLADRWGNALRRRASTPSVAS